LTSKLETQSHQSGSGLIAATSKRKTTLALVRILNLAPGRLSADRTLSVLVYMAPAVSTGPNTPQIWTKLFHYGYNATDKLWADQYFKKDAIPTKGHHFVKIPDVPAGKYLIRCVLLNFLEFQVQVLTSNNSRGHSPP
jgi:Auxiliary Activity family 9 (formerly GH61)